MKTLALTTLLTLAIGAYTPTLAQGPYDKRADAPKDIQAALTEAQADGKLVLLDFGAAAVDVSRLPGWRRDPSAYL